MIRKIVRTFVILFSMWCIAGCGAAPTEETAGSEEEAAPADLDAAETLVEDITPFVEWEPGSTSISFNEDAAIQAGLSEERITLAKDIILFSETVLNSTESLQEIEESPGATTRLQSVGVDLLYPGLTLLTTSAFQAFRVALSDTCPDPRFQPPITGWTTRSVAISKLTQVGYRYTKFPTGACAARGATAYGQLGGDYTKPLWYSVYGSAYTPCYRYQGVVSANSPWTFQVQGAPANGTTGTREPNPEICEYSWPTWWWGAYTAYFHMIYC